MPKISLIAAMSTNRAIGLNNALPWPEPIPIDWINLERVTAGKKMIMGRKSYDNPHRVWSKAGNFVITSQVGYPTDEGFQTVHSLQEALDLCQDQDEVFVIGGQSIFEEAIPIADKIELTIVNQNFEGDTFFPEFDESKFVIISNRKFEIGQGTAYPLSILTYEKQ
jgi:dihydrofolate reductase